MRFIFSDADYSFTARSRGWKIVVAPNAVVQHSLSGSGSGASIFLNKVKLQDQLYFSEKWLNGDLYRRLAFEGNRLESESINECIGLAKQQIKQFIELGY